MGFTTNQVTTTTARLAWIIEKFEAACGVGNATSETTGKAGANEQTHILGTADAAVITAMLPAATRLKDRLIASNYFGAVSEYMQYLDAVLGGLNDWLADNGIYLSYQLRKAFPGLQARYCFPPVTVLGTLLNTTGTWSDTLDADGLDADDSGPAKLEVVPTEETTLEIELEVTGVDFAGNIVTAEATIPAETSAAVSLGTARFARLTSTATTGGSSGDELTIQTVLDRDPAI